MYESFRSAVSIFIAEYAGQENLWFYSIFSDGFWAAFLCIIFILGIIILLDIF